MPDNTELLQKVVDTTLVGSGGGGILSPEQADRFIDYMVDQTVLTKSVRLVRMNSASREIDRIDLGTRKVRKATENTDDGVDADVTFDKISLNTVKVRLDWSLTSEALEDNIEGAALEDHIARLMSAQFGNDLEDLYINGDVTNTGDALLKTLDGWYKRAVNGAHTVSAPALGDSSRALDKATFNALIKAMPKKYLQQRSKLMFFTGTSPLQDFLNRLTDRSTPLGDSVIFGTPGGNGGGGATNIRPFGIPVVEVPLYDETLSGGYSGATGDHTWVDLTFPENRIVGVQREIKVYREFKPKKDAIEYTAYMRICNQIENLDAWVHCSDVKVQGS